MDGLLYRSFTPDLEIRSDGDGRTIRGIAVPWNKAVRIDSRLVEQFANGAANHQLRAPNRLAFAREHLNRGGTLIGPTKMLRNDAAGLYFEARASRTPMGDETVELVRDGALRHISVGFRERRNRSLPGGVVERVRADFFEIAVVRAGAYGDGASITGVRSAEPGDEWGPDVELEEELVRSGAGGGSERRYTAAEVAQLLARMPMLPPPI